MLKAIFAALAVSAASGWSYAQCSSCTTDPPIKVEVGTLTGGTTLVDCHSSGSNFSVNVGSLSGDVLIHIYDCASGTRTHDIGIVTITGYSSSVTSVAMMVAGQSESWDELGSVLLDYGCVNFGGLLVDDSRTLAITRASISAYGNIEHHASGSNPDIHVNQVVWVGARHSGGNIAAKIVADGGTLFGGAPDAIHHVRAWDTISGNIIASDKNIGEVHVVGTASGNPGGIQGDISAANGAIGQIWTSGPIGTSTHTVSITAGTRIGWVTCRDDETSGDGNVLEKPFYANIEASNLGVVDPSDFHSSIGGWLW